jgi:Fe-S cluster assembly protein SufD
MASATTQTAVQRYLSDFATFEANHPAPDWLQAKRREAIATFGRLGFPTVRDEEWKYTDITPAANLAVTPIFNPDLNGGTSHSYDTTVAPYLPFKQLPGHRLVFVNGHFIPALSHIGDLPAGVEVTNLASAISGASEILPEHFGRYVDGEEAFTALNTAFAQDGAFIRVPANVELEEPVHLVFLANGEEATVTHPRNLVLLGTSASAHVIETFVAAKDGAYLTNAVTEVATSPNARFEHVKVQLESEKAFHVGTLQLQAVRDVVASSHCINFGGRIVRNNAIAVLGDENGEVTLNGLVVAGNDQVIDNHTTMDHAMPHCASHEMYAHVLDGHANGVFNGKIFVREDAQKTDAKQSNRSLLLSRDAQINAKPQLEIFADDVRCTHGATIGQLEENALFYLRARGIPERAARTILIRAFAAEIIESVSIESLRDAITAEIARRLG